MEHLEFTKVDRPDRIRRKPGGFPGSNINKNNTQHGETLVFQFKQQTDETIEISKKYQFSPYLVVKVELEENALIDDSLQDKLEALGLKIIDIENKELMVLFADDIDLQEFNKALNDYKNGVVAITRVVNEDIFKIIKRASRWNKEDRMGHNLSTLQETDYVDCYLWVFDSIDETRHKANEFIDFSREHSARVCDKYISSSIAIVRLKITASELDTFLEHPLIYKIDSIPKYILAHERYIESKSASLDDLSYDNSKLNVDTSPSICVIDSGIFTGHPLLKEAIGDSKIFYATEGYSPNAIDISGHGTKVASICEYGQLEPSMPFIPEIYLFNAKIHDGQYIGNYELCLNELQQEGYNLTFNQQDVLYNYFTGELDIEQTVISLNLESRINEFKYILRKYINLYEKLWPSQMREVVEYFYSNYGCRVYNLSQGDLNNPYIDGKPRAWTCVLDELQNEMDIVFIVSAGNLYYERSIDSEITNVNSDYPKYFYKCKDCRIIDPANSVSSITVGSIAVTDTPYVTDDNTIRIMPITKSGQLSSLTRVGPGINKCIKPDFVAFGGDRCINAISNTFVNNNPGLSVLMLNRDLMNGLFCFDSGTSYAAPYISYIAAKLLGKYSNFSNNLIRAIIASSANIPDGIIKMLQDEVYKDSTCINDLQSEYKRKNNRSEYIFDKNRILHYSVGYGFPSLDKCLDSQENRVVLYSDMNDEDTCITPDTTHIFEIPIPSDFRNAPGDKRIIVSLAYNPEVRKTRLDYMGNTMSFDLIRGKSLEEVYNVCCSQAGKPKEDKLSMFANKYRCDMENVGPELRGKGTLQKGVFTFTRATDYGDNYYLVVDCEQKWSDNKQKYAVVVILETDSQVQLYNMVKQRVRTKRRIRA